MENDMPIALRRTPRRFGVRLDGNAATPSHRPARQTTASKTHTTTRQKKRPRSLDTDSIVVSEIEAEPLTPPRSGNQHTTHPAIPSTKRRKHSPRTPSHPTTTPENNNIVRIFPLRAILDDRVKRRIRRNGLSEEMNVIYGERRQRARKTVQEMTELREQLAAKEVENEMLREQSSLLQDTSRILELEKEISDLKQGVHSHDWDMAAGDGFSDNGSVMDTDDQFFRDDTTVEVDDVVSSSPPSAKPFLDRDAITTLTPPNTSPTKPGTPDGPRHFFPLATCDMGVQSDLSGADMASLEAELTSLRCELASTQKALDAQAQLETQLQAKLASAEKHDASANVDPDHQLQMDIMVQALADKTATIAALNASLSSLGSPGMESSYIVSTLKEAFQAARQELEDMCTDEHSSSVSSEGTDILQHMLHSLRDSAAQVKQHETTLQACCTREEQLRQQLDDRDEALGTMGRKMRQKDDRIFRLEADVERAEGAAEGYRVSLADARRTMGQKDAELAVMGENLESMMAAAADLQAQLAQVHVDREMDMVAREAAYTDDIARRDGQVLELRKEITGLKEALKLAHGAVSQLQDDNSRLQGDADREKKAARDTVTSLRTQLLQSLQMSEAFLA